jgi:hypothetical protein
MESAQSRGMTFLCTGLECPRHGAGSFAAQHIVGVKLTRTVATLQHLVYNMSLVVVWVRRYQVATSP